MVLSKDRSQASEKAEGTRIWGSHPQNWVPGGSAAFVPKLSSASDRQEALTDNTSKEHAGNPA